MNRADKSTIAARMSPKGTGGIAAIHLAGNRAAKILAALFVDKRGNPAHTPRPGNIRYGFIAETDEGAIDEVLVAALRKDMFEINCHGGALSVQATLETLRRAGAMIVSSDEMLCKHGILKDRGAIQREAWRLFLSAESTLAARHLLAQFEGALSKALAEIGSLVDKNQSRAALEKTRGLLSTAPFGIALSRAPRVVIAGKPNVGKSSLLNSVLNFNRAIVADVPGTTRDIVHGTTLINEVAFKFHDTAGLRAADTHPEIQGVRRAETAMETADCVIYMIDSSRRAQDEDADAVKRLAGGGGKIVVCLNKIDLGESEGLAERITAIQPTPTVLRTCCIRGQGVEELRRAVFAACVPGRRPEPQSAIIFTEEQEKLCAKAAQYLDAPAPLSPAAKEACRRILGELTERQRTA